METIDRVNQVTEAVIGSAIEVHKVLGPGLLESAYRSCLVYELSQRGLKVEAEKPLPVQYKGIHVDCGYRLDLVVENCVVVELKSVDQIAPIHEAQLLSYLKLSGLEAGLLINFNVTLLKDGVRRRVRDEDNKYQAYSRRKPLSPVHSSE